MNRPALVLGPSLGTAAEALWGQVAERLANRADILLWDLPGHGTRSGEQVPGPLTMADLAADLQRYADSRGLQRFHYAGVSVGGCIGLELALRAPERLTTLTVLCSGARIGSPAMWHDRVAQVRAHGPGSLVAAAQERWFAPGFGARQPAVADALLASLASVSTEGYAAVCHALADFDARDRLSEVAMPVLAVAGADDRATPPASLREIADGVPEGRFVELAEVAHLAPAEAPDRVTQLVLDQMESFS
ncbi:alpha/beta fold hydrolase [Calidifontibacter sp. DB0510]|uniref:Alpha/beta fold hydrolase n=1 Tax=Metallococcus carri TaxID=1656884 RepID=A0A967EHF2_9MICO|nr:alpha/beta fold hydrolase [Metallococcus carri]NHN56268.1 alpha/beta fold hydrolase [Metallococcus carri]NOP38680.1 alpha/beta fold hydrolase [Calidifontibacter sp. DB2511S]